MKNKITVNGKEVDDYKLHIEGYKREDSWIEWATFVDGTELTYDELIQFETDYLAALVYG